MRLHDIKQSLPYFFKAGVVPCVWGKHGIGKSQIFRQYAEENGLTFVDIRLGQLEVGDLLGLPEIVDGTNGKITAYATPDWLEVAKSGNCLILWDELNRARPDVLQAIFQAVLDFQYHGVKFAPTTYQAVACNPNSIEYQVTELDAALMSRFCHIKATPSNSEWIDYAENTKHHDSVIDFIKQYPNMLGNESVNYNLDIKPNSRSWTMLSRIMSTKPSEELLTEMAAGLIGLAATTNFIESLHEFEKPIHAVDVFDNWSEVRGKVKKFSEPKGARVDLLKIAADEIIKIVHNLAKDNQDINPKRKKNVIEFIKTVPRELAFAIMRELGAVGVGKWLEEFTGDSDLVKTMREAIQND